MKMAVSQRPPIRCGARRDQQVIQFGVGQSRKDGALHIERVGMHDQQVLSRGRRDAMRKGQVGKVCCALGAESLAHPRPVFAEPPLAFPRRDVVGLAGKECVSVPLDHVRTQRAHPVHHFRRPGPRPHEVAGHDDLIERPMQRQIGQNGVEGYQVAMNIGKQCNTHHCVFPFHQARTMAAPTTPGPA
jgi:hypothetical protein